MSDAAPAYRIGRRLGRGAVASVHEVFDTQGQRFAGKFLHASRDGDALAAARFAQEAALLHGLSHPNLVRVDGPAEGVDDDGQRRTFVRMELVDGPGLDQLIAREAPLREAEVVEFGRQLAAGLTYAHGRGIVHRDLKPANVLVAQADPDPDNPHDSQPTRTLKIADFGMARASSLAGVDARALTILGTPDYMAPESLDPLAVDARADLYALGCMLFEMLTGAVPFPAATPFGTLARHRDDPIPPLPEVVSAELRALIESLMAKSPADRPPAAGMVADRLAALANNDTSLVPIAAQADSRCAGCGQALVEYVGVCLNCGLPAVSLEPGAHAVIITGPGEVGDKMDSAMRDRLRAWLRDNPQLGLAAAKGLEARIPRMPVVFASKVSERCARGIVGSLGALGIFAETHAGRPFSHELVRKKAKKLTGRIGLIALTSMGGLFQTGVALPVILAVGAVGAIIGTSIHSARALTQTAGSGLTALGPALHEAFSGVESVAASLPEARHRHALRAVVRQSLDLREHLGPELAEAELAQAIASATVTTSKLATIDARLRELDLNDGSASTRELLHQRDHLAGRLAELAGALESLRVRARVSRARAGAGAGDDDLAELRDRVEALEEVQSL